MKTYDNKINTNFYGNKILKEGSHCVCLSVKVIGSVFKTCKKFYPQAFLESCKYIYKKEKDKHIHYY